MPSYTIAHMKLELIAIGKEDAAYQPLVADYTRRITHYVPFSITLIPAPRIGGKGSEAMQKEKEAALILKHLGNDDSLILLDERGKSLTSPKFADLLNRHLVSGKKRLIFLIGGAYGVHESIKNRASFILSLSAMTYPHQLARLVFTEQLYRAMTILRNESYHH
jgi:23S rRNA (pseudouridine1915-N3)-methyltransferase